MALKHYEVKIGGITHTLKLSDEDAKRYKDAKQVSAPSANKSRTASNK